MTLRKSVFDAMKRAVYSQKTRCGVLELYFMEIMKPYVFQCVLRDIARHFKGNVAIKGTISEEGHMRITYELDTEYLSRIMQRFDCPECEEGGMEDNDCEYVCDNGHRWTFDFGLFKCILIEEDSGCEASAGE